MKEKMRQKLKIAAVVIYCILWSVICIADMAKYEMIHRN